LWLAVFAFHLVVFLSAAMIIKTWGTTQEAAESY
jgi:hypothetical protein